MGAKPQRSAQTVLPKSGFTWWSCGHCSFHRQIDIIALISPVANTTLSLAYPGQALSQYSAPSCWFPTAFWVAKGEIWGFFLQLEDVARARQAWQHRHVFGHSWGHTVCTWGISETWHGGVWPQAGQAGLCFPSALWRAAGTAAPPNASGSTVSRTSEEGCVTRPWPAPGWVSARDGLTASSFSWRPDKGLVSVFSQCTC